MSQQFCIINVVLVISLCFIYRMGKIIEFSRYASFKVPLNLTSGYKDLRISY